MAYKSNIAINPRVFYTLLGGDDNEAGTSLETAKATIQGTVDAVNALVPPVNVLNRAAIFISGAGIFQESITFPEFTNYHAKDITNTVSVGNLYTLNNISTYEVGLSAVSTAAGIIFDIANLANVSVSCSDATILGAAGRAVSVTGTSNNIFISINQLRVVGDNAIGIDHKGTNGEPEIFIVGDATLEGDTVTCFLHDPTNVSARSVLEVASINEFATANNTTGIQVIDGHLSVFCNEIIATNALDVDGGILSYIGTCVTGNINVAVGATLNCEIAEFTGVITNLGTITGRIGTQFFGAGIVTAPLPLPNDAVIRGDGGTDVDAAPHLSAPNNRLIIQSSVATDTIDLSVNDSVGGERLALRWNGTTGIASFVTPGGSVFDCGDGDSQAFQTWTSIGGANGSAFNWNVGDRNPLGNVVGNQSFYLRGNGANSNIYLKKNGLVDTAGWVPVITGPNTATVVNKLMLWGDVVGSSALDNTIISYTPGAINFLDFRHATVGQISGIRWFAFSGAAGPNLNFIETTNQFTIVNSGDILIFAPGITFDNRSLTLPTISRSLAASTVELFEWVRTGSNSADVSVFIASIAPAGGGDGDLAVRQDTVNTDLYINVNGVWTPLLGSIIPETLEQTLTAGNTTSGSDISITGTDSIIAPSTRSTVNVLELNNLDDLTTGGAINIASNSPSTASRVLVDIVNDNTAAVNATVLRLRNDAVAGPAAPVLDVTGTTFFRTGPLETGEIGFGIECPGTTGGAFIFQIATAGSIDPSTTVADISQNDATATNTVALEIGNLSTDAASRAISVFGSSEFTGSIATGVGTLFDGTATTGIGVSIQSDSLTTGSALTVVSASVDASPRTLVDIVNDEAGAVETTNLSLRQDSTGSLFQIIRSGATVDFYTDNQTAQLNITANPGDINFVDNSLNSHIEINIGAVSNNDSWVDCLGGPSLIIFGANSIASTTTTRYLFPGFSDNTAPTAAVAVRIPHRGFIRSLTIQQNIPAGNGNDIVYTVRVNGVATALAVTIASTDTTGLDINIVAVALSDTIDIEVTKALAIGSTPNEIVATFEYL